MRTASHDPASETVLFYVSAPVSIAARTSVNGRTALRGPAFVVSVTPPAAGATRWRAATTAASFPQAVRRTEEVVPVNVSTWVLPSGVTVGR